jgi:hypothetical protein
MVPCKPGVSLPARGAFMLACGGEVPAFAHLDRSVQPRLQLRPSAIRYDAARRAQLRERALHQDPRTAISRVQRATSVSPGTSVVAVTVRLRRMDLVVCSSNSRSARLRSTSESNGVTNAARQRTMHRTPSAYASSSIHPCAASGKPRPVPTQTFADRPQRTSDSSAPGTSSDNDNQAIHRRECRDIARRSQRRTPSPAEADPLLHRLLSRWCKASNARDNALGDVIQPLQAATSSDSNRPACTDARSTPSL